MEETETMHETKTEDGKDRKVRGEQMETAGKTENKKAKTTEKTDTKENTEKGKQRGRR